MLLFLPDIRKSQALNFVMREGGDIEMTRIRRRGGGGGGGKLEIPDSIFLHQTKMSYNLKEVKSNVVFDPTSSANVSENTHVF